MQFGDAEREYRGLKAQFEAGRLSEADFRAKLEDMMIEDADGKWWSIGFETGKWYYHDGQQWVRGDPPADKATTPPASVTRSAAVDVAPVGAPATNVEPAGSGAGKPAAAGALGGAAAATPAAPVPAAAPAGGTRGAASAAQAPAEAPNRSRSILLAVAGVLAVLVLAVGAYIILSQRFMVMSKEDMAAMTPTAASGQAGGMAPESTMPAELSPTVAAVAALPAATETPADTPSPTSAPAAYAATSEPTALVQPTTAPAASPVPDTPTPEPPTPEPPTPEPPTPTLEPPTSTPPPPTATPAPPATKRPAATATQAPAAAQPAAPAVPGLITGFEQFGTWRIGDQPYGTLTRSTQEKHSGSASARLDYNIPAVKDNYVVFTARPPLNLPGTPTALSAWVYGDGSGHFLSVWVKDSQGEVWAFHLGPVPEAGAWTKLTALFDPTAKWPQGHISGPDNGKLDYPIQLYAIVLDAVPDYTAAQGTIYLDDIMIASGS